MDDEELSRLLSAVAAGDRASLGRLYRAVGPVLFAVGLKLLRRRDQAEEVLHDAFVRIWQKAHLYDPDRGTPLPWLVTLMRRCALDRLRAERSTPEPVDLDELDPLLEATPGPGTDRDLRRCLGRLNDGARRAIVLAYIHGLTHDEIATALQSPLGTVKSWIRRGLAQLKVCLES